VVTIEDGLRAGGAGEGIRYAVGQVDPTTDVHVLGVPTEYIPQGKPDAILAGFGLDADGIVRTVHAARDTIE